MRPKPTLSEKKVGHYLTIDNGSASPNLLHDPMAAFMLRCQVKDHSSATLRSYDYVLRSFDKFLGDMLLADVTPIAVSRYVLHLKKDRGLKPPSIGVHYRTLHTFFQYLVKEGFMLENPTSGDLHQPKKLKRFPYCLEEYQVKSMLHASLQQCSSFMGIRNHVMILTFLGSGLRLAELVSLNMESAYMPDGLMRVIGKGDKERVVCMSEKLERILPRYINWRRSLQSADSHDPLFVTRNGRIKARHVEAIVTRLGERAGISGVRCSPHTLRHTCATMLIAGGVDPYAVQELLGHESPETTKIYVHMTGIRLKEAYRRADPLRMF